MQLRIRCNSGEYNDELFIATFLQASVRSSGFLYNCSMLHITDLRTKGLMQMSVVGLRYWGSPATVGHRYVALLPTLLLYIVRQFLGIGIPRQNFPPPLSRPRLQPCVLHGEEVVLLVRPRWPRDNGEFEWSAQAFRIRLQPPLLSFASCLEHDLDPREFSVFYSFFVRVSHRADAYSLPGRGMSLD